ncbi:hypothetical protein [Pseudalkalibacillus sp. SCS-8]|uniref:hypothetical protein n=1 Tax=Pseudalkalibacillus nanhaiensis TaxID=3115291 RepID=UPI0032DB540D
MKKSVVTLFGIIIFTILLLSYFEYKEKQHAFSTPETALNNLKEMDLEVVEIISTRFFEKESVAYTFYYSKINRPKDYLAVAKFNKNNHGWRFENVIGVGNIDLNNVGNSVEKNGTLIGFSDYGVKSVELDVHKAEIVPLEEKQLKVWLFHGLNHEEKEDEIQFLHMD